MSLSDWQVQVGSLVLGAGTRYHITAITGLGQPDKRTADQARSLADGDFMGSSFYGPRSVVIELTMFADTSAEVVAMRTALSLAWRGSPTLYIKLPGWDTRAIVGEPRRMKADDVTTIKAGRIPATLEYYSPYPAMFSPVADLGGPSHPVGGQTFPHAAPFVFGDFDAGADVAPNNLGDLPYAPVMRIYGPVENPVITRASDGAFFGLAYTVPAGAYVEIDHDVRTVVSSAGVSLRRYMTPGSSWLSIPPGTETFTMTSTSYGGTPWLHVAARSAWLA